MRVENIIWATIAVGIVFALLLAAYFAGFYIRASISEWDPFKYRPYILGSFELNGGATIISAPFDVYVVINGR